MSETFKTASVLGIKIDEHSTKLFLFDIVDGKYTLLATSESGSTHKSPYFDLREGIIKAIDDIQSITGRFIADEEMNLIIPSQDDGNGVDLISVSLGFLDKVTVIPVGLLENVSIESNTNLMQMTHLSVVDSISLNDSRSLQEIFSQINNIRPDLIFLSGGIQNGAKKSIFRLFEIILFCVKHIPHSDAPTIIFAGNSQFAEKIKELSTDQKINVHVTENVRPGLEFENLSPSLETINSINNQILTKKIPGLEFLLTQTQSQPISYSQGIGTIVKFLSKLNPQKTENALWIDINKEMIIIAGNLNNQTSIYKQKSLPLKEADDFIENVNFSEIENWINFEIDHECLKNYVANKLIHPNSIPENKEDLTIEISLFKFILKESLSKFKSISKTRNNFNQQIFVNGEFLYLYLSNKNLLLFLLDAVQPYGITNFYFDQHGLLPILGSVAINNSILPVQILDGNAISLLAKVFSFPGKNKDSSPIMNVILEYEDGSKLEELIPNGTLKTLPVTSGKFVKLFIHAIGNFEFKNLLKPFEKGISVQGGNLGIIFDTRQRPIVLPKISSERIDILNRWQKDISL